MGPRSQAGEWGLMEAGVLRCPVRQTSHSHRRVGGRGWRAC
jgi:hypothetical protein